MLLTHVCFLETCRNCKMTSKTQPLENTSVSTWLAELHMECYKKNLENFDTIRVSAVRLHRWSLVCMYYV